VSNGWRGGSTTRWRLLRAYVLERDHYLCRIGTAGVCVGAASHVDHIVPKSAGGEDTESNLRAACEPCNLHRGAARVRAPEPAPRPVSQW
jgi:5-methylcytosine-specific restriction endonuclease McrA